MAQAGFTNLFVGIETPDEPSLPECNKSHNKTRNLVESVKILQRHGMQVMAGFIIGFDSDTPSIFQQQIDLIQRSGIVTAMVGLLQAPKGTELYARLQREGRLLGEMSGDNVVDETNFVTRMDREYLRSNYRALVESLYQPDRYYARVRNLLTVYKEPREGPLLTRDVVLATLRCFFWLGLVRAGRTHFWHTLLWTCCFRRKSVQTFLGLAILGYHFRRIYQDLLSRPPRVPPGAVVAGEVADPQPVVGTLNR